MNSIFVANNITFEIANTVNSNFDNHDVLEIFNSNQFYEYASRINQTSKGLISPMNLITKFLFLGKDFIDDERLMKTCNIIENLVVFARNNIKSHYKPQKKLQKLRAYARKQNINRLHSDFLLPFQFRLGDITATLLTMAVGQELDWPIYFYRAPDDYTFIRWKDSINCYDFNLLDGKIRFKNYWKRYLRDARRVQDFEIQTDVITWHVHDMLSVPYLRDQTYREIITYFYILCGSLAFSNENLEKSLKYDNYAIQLNPKDPLAYQARAVTRDELGDCDKALDDINTAIDIMPFNPWYYMHRAIIKSNSRDWVGAEDDFDKALDLSSKRDCRRQIIINHKAFFILQRRLHN